MNNTIEVVTIPKVLFIRMSQALIGIEKVLREKEESENNWISEEAALRLLGCSQRQLYRLKGKGIKYKSVGRKHQYSKKSIEKYNELMSS